ncbi:MAG: LPXTG cell wall anchor domain-containing protein, partial [bacterium]|nr:LPXTG cell wall anchor domain-containing protein [bacterium]
EEEAPEAPVEEIPVEAPSNTDEAPEAPETEVEEKLPETGGMHLYMVGIALALLVAGSLLLASSKIRAAHKVVA